MTFEMKLCLLFVDACDNKQDLWMTTPRFTISRKKPNIFIGSTTPRCSFQLEAAAALGGRGRRIIAGSDGAAPISRRALCLTIAFTGEAVTRAVNIV